MSNYRKLSFLSFLFAIGCYVLFFAQTSQTQTRIDFNHDIRPILSDKCFACHGPDATAKNIKLRLDSEAGMLAALNRGRRAVVPGEPEQSELVKRITHKDEAMRMPPADFGRTLSAQEIELLTEWIRQGAKWQTHWAFVAPTRPSLPAVKNKAWPKNEIDYFVLARLEKEGLQPSPEADRATLLRRVSLDLTGLPPTLQELDDFLKDNSPNAYEKVVDRLLASPRYGERMAFKWLDAARYADTNGYQIDGERFMWRWRDWVINAFNRNMPFDQFTVEQLAGDMLPTPTLDQRIATAFNRNHRQNSEDGLVPEEYAVEYVVDRVDTTSTIFLGLTLGCARCHNHKYDPFTQKEYYQLYAYFNSIPEDGRAHNYGNSRPWISAPTDAQQAAHKKLLERLTSRQTNLAKQLKTNVKAQEQWASKLKTNDELQWFPRESLILRHAMDSGAKLQLLDNNERIDIAKPEQPQAPKPLPKADEVGFRDGSPQYVTSPTGQGVAFDGKLVVEAGKVADFNFRDRLRDFKDQFTISAWFYAENENSGSIVTRIQDKVEEKDNNLPKTKGYGLFLLNGKLHFNAVGVWADDSWRVETAEPVALKQWHHVLAVFDSQSPYERAQIYLNGQKQPLKINNNRLFRTFNDDRALLRIGGGGGPEYRFKGMLDEVRIYKTAPDEELLALLSCADSVLQIASIPLSQRTLGQQLKLQYAWLENAAPIALQKEWEQITKLKAEIAGLESEFPTIMVMQEIPQPRPTFILRRGAYDLPGDKVTRAIPASLNFSNTSSQPANRLEFARWLISPQNPLTARVTVNRFWQMLFGTGLVKTAEDFGAQGELPSHPELLDWLAVAFRDGIAGCGARIADCSDQTSTDRKPWNMKALLRLIVTSATYRQSSAFDPQSTIRNPQSDDPDNRQLARGPRFRLSAEMIRDQALSVSGLLVEKLGGPSVKPYQPEGLWKDMLFSNMTNYDQAKGDDLWRRSLYTFWKRTVLNPSMLVFDATAREACTVRESRTNTPLQALNLMNDVTYIEAARLLAERMMTEGGASPEARLAWGFQALTMRTPDEVERRTLLENLQSQLNYFRSNPNEAEKLLAIGEKRNSKKLNASELAAYATTASLILNLDEVITKQ